MGSRVAGATSAAGSGAACNVSVACGVGSNELLGPNASEHSASRRRDGLTQSRSQLEHATANALINTAPTSSFTRTRQQESHRISQAAMLTSSLTQPRRNRVSGQIGRIARVNAGNYRAHQAINHRLPHARGHKPRQSLALSALAHLTAQLAVLGGTLRSLSAQNSDDVVRARIGRNAQVGITQEPPQTPVALTIGAVGR